jgi:pyruvate formate lyase activating enzyme
MTENSGANDLANINIAGWAKLSTVDWPMNLVATLFLQGCPWRCNYCHNSDILDPNVRGEINWNEVVEFMTTRVGLLDGIVFSGGEAILQASPTMTDSGDLRYDGGELLKAIKQIEAIPARGYNQGLNFAPEAASSQPAHARAFKIGLHTGGYDPDRLRSVIRHVDWIGFDIKAPTGLYDDITNIKGSEIKARQSLGIVQEEQEFRKNTDRPLDITYRTTIDPTVFTKADIERLQDEVKEKGINELVLQEMRTIGAPAQYVAEYEAESKAHTLKYQG